MQKITPFLWFDNQAEEAMNFYVSIFKNSKVGSMTRYGEEGAEVSGRPKGTVMTATFETRRARIYSVKWWSTVQIHRGPIVCRELQNAGGNR